MGIERLKHLGDISVENFLKNYWQQKPLLIRGAFPNYQSPLSAEELAGLSLEEDVVSRLVLEKGWDNNTPWQLEHGPFDESLYSRLPESHWTLLVQHADLLVPELSELLRAFSFIPRWRLDDIMISYAADQGSVGPHYDHYDVFLLQVEGKRRWQLGQQCYETSALLKGLDMKILAEFEAQQDWVLEPGDMLYVPPGLAHWGVAQGACITYSVGFRAASHSDILLDYFTEAAAQSAEHQRYSDSGLALQKHDAEIGTDVIERLQNILQTYANNPQALAKWFGQYMTRPNPCGPGFGMEPLHEASLRNGEPFTLAPQKRSAFYAVTEREALLFIEGEQWICDPEFAKDLCDYKCLNFATLSEHAKQVAIELVEQELLINAQEL